MARSKMMTRGLGVLSLTVLAVTACGPVQADPGQLVATKREGIVSGHITLDDPQIFAFLGPGWLCSSTLIGRRTLLTAGHCVTDENNGGAVITTAGTAATNILDAEHGHQGDYYGVIGVARHPRYAAGNGAPSNDVALLQLANEPPVPLKPWNQDPLTDGMVSSELRVVGYGDTSADFGAGLKRTGLTTLKAISADSFAYGPAGPNTGGTCQGDSGGPALRRFADGTERVVGVTSYGYTGCVGASHDPRVDAFATFINATLDKFERGSCLEDGICHAGCTPVDPDCACVDDGVCNAACTGLALDPDCNSSCGLDGVCTSPTAACTSFDPDCWQVGHTCGYEGHCGTRLCVSSPQHAQPYCTKTCGATADCPGDMECVTNQCRFKLHPSATAGQPCTLNDTFCEGTNMVCAALATTPATTTCSKVCLEDADCGHDATCRKSPQVPGVCVANVLLNHLSDEELSPSKGGCTGVPGVLVLAALAVFGLRRRR